MAKKHPLAIFLGSVIAGLFLGIFFLTGLDASPTGIALNITSILVSTVPNTPISEIWPLAKSIILLLGLLATAITAIELIYSGIYGAVSAALGYLSGFMIVFNPILGIVVTVASSVAIVIFAKDQPNYSETKK